MEQAYAAIGRAVFAAQLFETALIPIFECFKMQTKPGYREKTGGYIRAGMFKVSIRGVVKALSAEGDIATDLEGRLNSFTEDRHTLVHRWIRERGWPAEGDAEGFAPIIELANRVERDAKELTNQFAGYMAKFAGPDQAEKFKARIAHVFHRAHIEG